jgi:hypothetical protein
MRKPKNRFFRNGKQIFPKFFYWINLSVDKVYNAKNIFWLATLYRKIGRKVTFEFENFEINFLS